MRCRVTTASRALLALSLISGTMAAQTRKGKPNPPPAAAAAPAPQKIDEEYTKLIKEYLQDPRISTELVDHMPASDTVPSPLKFFGRIPGNAGRAHLRQGHRPLLRSAGQGVPARQVLEDRHRPRKAATW